MASKLKERPRRHIVLHEDALVSGLWSLKPSPKPPGGKLGCAGLAAAAAAPVAPARAL